MKLIKQENVVKKCEFENIIIL